MNKKKIKKYEGGGVQGFLQGISPILGMVPGVGGALNAGAGLIGGLLGRLEDQEVDHKKALVDNPYMAHGGMINKGMRDYVFSKKLGTATDLESALKKLGAYDAVVKYKGRKHKDGGILVNEKYQTIAGGTTSRQKMEFGGTPIAELEGGEIRVEPNELDGLDEITRNTALMQIRNAMKQNEQLRIAKNGGNMKYNDGGSIQPFSGITGYNVDPLFGIVDDATQARLNEQMNYLPTGLAERSGMPPATSWKLGLPAGIMNITPVPGSIGANTASTQMAPITAVPPVSPTSRTPQLMAKTGPTSTTPTVNKTSNSMKTSNKQSSTKVMDGELSPLMLGKGLEILSQLPGILRGVEQEQLQLNPNAAAVESQMRQRRINLDPMRNAIMSQRSANVKSAGNNARSAALRNAMTNAAYSRAGQSLAEVSMQEQQMRNQYRADLANTLNNLGMQEAAERIRKQTADSQNQAAFDNSLRELGRTAGNIGTFAQNYRTNKLSNQEMLQLMNRQYSRFGNTQDINEYRKNVLAGQSNIQFKQMYGGYFPKRKRR